MAYRIIRQNENKTTTAVSVIKAVLTPCRVKVCSLYISDPMTIQIPMMPVRIIITAAKTVSRASVTVLRLSAPIIIEIISPTSITVMANARSSVPKGSPNLCAITSEW